MSAEKNKKLTLELFARFSASDVDGVLGMLSDDLSWWIAGKPGLSPAAGVKSKTEMAQMFGNIYGRMKDGMKMTVKSQIAEGDKVAAEVVSYGELKNGRVYNQEYHMLLTFRDGKVAAVREYLDTQHVFATWFQP